MARYFVIIQDVGASMSSISRSDIQSYEHTRLPLRYALAIVCTIAMLPIFALLAIFGIVSLLLFWFIALVWIGAEIFFAYMVDNSVLVSELNYPRIYTLAEEVRATLAVKRPISIFVYEHGSFNTLLVRMFRRRAIFMNSDVLETGVTDDEVRWLVGRFVGYLRIQQDTGFIGWLVRLTERTGIFTFFVFPYNRAMVYTGDRLGLAAIDGDIASAVSAMQKLLVGRQLGYSVNPLGIVDQRRRTKGSLFAFLARLASPFPSTTARYVDLVAFAQRRYPEAYERFAATTPGLSSDLHLLSGERTTAASIWKLIGYYCALGLGILLTIALWAAWLAGMGQFLNPRPTADYAVNDHADDSMMADTVETPDAMANTTDAPPADAFDTMGSMESNLTAPASIAPSGYYIFCIGNRTDGDMNFEVRYGDSVQWLPRTVAASQTIVVWSVSSGTPRVRFTSEAEEGNTPHSYTLVSEYATGHDACGRQRFDFEVTNAGVDLVDRNK